MLTAATPPPTKTGKPPVCRHVSTELRWAPAAATSAPHRCHGAGLLFLLCSSIRRNRHLNYVKEEMSAKELSSSPVLWHEKQLNQTQKARFMQKLKSGNAKVKGLSLLLRHGSAYDGGHSSCLALKPERPHPAAEL